jgi:hypothetical protein
MVDRPHRISGICSSFGEPSLRIDVVEFRVPISVYMGAATVKVKDKKRGPITGPTRVHERSNWATGTVSRLTG